MTLPTDHQPGRYLTGDTGACARDPSAGETLARFIDVLNAGDSATSQLRSWRQSPIHADILHRQDRAPLDWEATLLRSGSHATVQHRRIRLCDARGVGLSDAEAVVLMDRLPAQARHQLRTSSDPLGAVIRPLGFRRTLLSLSLWPPTGHVLEVTAILAVDGDPVAYVSERYCPSVLRPRQDRPGTDLDRDWAYRERK